MATQLPTNTPDAFLKALQHAIEQAVQEESKIVLEEAMKAIDARVKRRVAEIAIRVAGSASIVSLRNELQITVKMN